MGSKREPKKPGKKQNRADHEALFARVKPLLGKALAYFRSKQPVPPKKAAVLVMALQQFLTAHECYPPPEGWEPPADLDAD